MADSCRQGLLTLSIDSGSLCQDPPLSSCSWFSGSHEVSQGWRDPEQEWGGVGQVTGDLDCALGPSLRGKGSLSRARQRHSRVPRELLTSGWLLCAERGKGRCREQQGAQSSDVHVTGVELERRRGKFKSGREVRQRSLWEWCFSCWKEQKVLKVALPGTSSTLPTIPISVQRGRHLWLPGYKQTMFYQLPQVLVFWAW